MEEEKKMTGYPSIDKPWLKYYTAIPDNLPDPGMSMYEFLYENNKDRLDNIALNYFGRKISYRQLFEGIDKTASALKTYGVRKGDIVSLCALNMPEFIYLLYGLNKIGAVSNWIGLTSPEADIHEQLNSTGTKLVFTVDLASDLISKASKNTEVEKTVVIPIENSIPVFMRTAVKIKNIGKYNKQGVRWKDFIKAQSEKADLESADPEAMAMIEYTGGSTGTPKGVMLSSKNLNSYYVNLAIANSSGIFNYNESDRYLSGVPFFLAFGMSVCCHSPLSHSMELILAPDPNPNPGTDIIIKSRVQHVVGGRLLVERLIDKAHKNHSDLSFVKSVVYGGEEANASWERTVIAELYDNNATALLINGYGMTETSAATIVEIDNEKTEFVPLANINIMITDPDNSSLEKGCETEGELCISSDTVMLGYYKNEEETNEVMFDNKGKRWLKTRDLAVVSPDGFVRITGRIKRVYSKLDSEGIQIRVYPMRIEETISEDPAVEKCAVVGIKDDKTAYRTIAYLILKDGSENKEKITQRIIEYCQKNLPESHVPDDYVIVNEFPLTRAGKVDYRRLEEMAAASLISADK